MLGEMCFQQGLRLNHFRDGVKINADASGRESKAPRRGFDQKPIGVEFRGDQVADALQRATQPPVQQTQPPQKKRRRIIEL